MYSEEKPFRSPLCLKSTFRASSDWFWQSSRVQLSWQPRTTAHCLHRRLLWLWPVLVSAGGFCCAAAVKRGSEREPLTPPPGLPAPHAVLGCNEPRRRPRRRLPSFPTAPKTARSHARRTSDTQFSARHAQENSRNARGCHGPCITYKPQDGQLSVWHF